MLAMIRRLVIVVGALALTATGTAAAVGSTPGLGGHFVRITSPGAGQVVGSRVTVRGTAKPGDATILVGYRKGGGEPTIGTTTARGGRWHVRVRLPRAARTIVVVSVSGGEDSVRVGRR
jgi:hypothetical protein